MLRALQPGTGLRDSRLGAFFVGIALAMVAALAVGVRASCVPLPDPYSEPGYFYDISPLTNNVSNYRGVYSTSVEYELQFCRTLVTSPDPIKCAVSTTLVCERFQTNYNPVGVQPTTLAVVGNGQLTLTYSKGKIWVVFRVTP